ncbi:adenylyl cyclase [Nakamurella sp.]|uniref:adenylyl cyclase n=1 Tax=Nakamurella sp. TaxID=1869182 RepID=UPI003B3A50AE
MKLARFLRFVVLVTAVTVASVAAPALAAADPGGGGGGYGSSGGSSAARLESSANVTIFDPSMPVAQIKATVDAIAAQQVPNQFGPERYALLFKPGIYGTAAEPLNFEVGYYTSVAGLGRLPGDVTINGSVYVRNQCENGSCTALNNFWRSLSNLTIAVTTPDFGCYSGQFWAVSQAAPMRRVHVQGQTTLMDYCTGPSYASGGFIADSQFDATVINGSQQQWLTRNSALTSWSNGVWNQVFSGVTNAPAPCFPAVKNPDGSVACGPYTTIDKSPVTKEAPTLYLDSAGKYQVFVPAVRTDTSGVSWADGNPAGTSIPLDRFYVAKPGDSAQQINAALARGQHLLLTPGQYPLDQAIRVNRANTVVLGLGYATLIPQRGDAALTVGDVPGVDIAGVTVDAGPRNSKVLIKVGNRRGGPCGSAGNPIVLHDVFVRIGGAAAGQASVSIEVNADHTILDNIWAWRADHGNGVGWTVNTADTGVVVNGDAVTAYGLFVEHYQKTQTVWNGNGGRVIFFQNEMPYDPPNQAAWTQRSGELGYPALKVSDRVRTFSGTGMGSYSFFSKAYNNGADVYADNAFEVPSRLAPGSLTNLLTIFLDPSTGTGGIKNVINGTGGSSTIANPSVPVTVVSYP